MLFTKFGCACKIVAYCGKHTPKGWQFPVMLVKVRYEDTGDERFYFPAYMRADGGINEIEAAVDAAPKVSLNKTELKAALEQAS